MKKKKVGRPKSNKVRLHIMVKPEVEKLASEIGYTKFFELAADWYVNKRRIKK